MLLLIWHLFNEAKREGKTGNEVTWPFQFVEHPAGPVPEDSVWNPKYQIYHGPEENNQGGGATLHPSKNFSDPSMSPLFESVKQIHYINATEVGPAESLCYAYYGVQNFPLEFYYDLARHIWDEMRHAEMGMRRLKQLGYTTEDYKFLKGSPGKAISDEWLADMYTGLTMISEPCSFLKEKESCRVFLEIW